MSSAPPNFKEQREALLHVKKLSGRNTGLLASRCRYPNPSRFGTSLFASFQCRKMAMRASHPGGRQISDNVKDSRIASGICALLLRPHCWPPPFRMNRRLVRFLRPPFRSDTPAVSDHTYIGTQHPPLNAFHTRIILVLRRRFPVSKPARYKRLVARASSPCSVPWASCPCLSPFHRKLKPTMSQPSAQT